MADKWDDATRKLIELTKSGQLDWEPDDEIPERRKASSPTVGPAYVTELNGKRIAVYEARTVVWDDDGTMIPYTGTHVVVEFVDEHGNSEWRWPSAKGKYELLELIRYQCSDAENFLAKLL
jgi:hypothetical protein